MKVLTKSFYCYLLHVYFNFSKIKLERLDIVIILLRMLITSSNLAVQEKLN